MAENDFSSSITASKAVSDSFEFKWTVRNYFSDGYLSDGFCQEFFSKLCGGIKFQIIVYKCDTRRNRNPMFIVKVVMKENAENSVIKTFLFFEIRDNNGHLYLKDSIENRFSHLNEEYECDGFEMPLYKPVYGLLSDGRRYEMHFQEGKFIIKGSVIFQCYEENIVSQPLCENISQLQSDLKGLLKNNFYADIKFLIGDDILHAHKNILCSRSVVFKKMFEQNMKENKDSTVEITDIQKPVFEAFLSFLYTGTIRNNELDIVMSLYSVADKYAVETLVKTCSNLLVGYLSDKTVPLILKLADKHNDATLKATAIDFICKNFEEVETTDSWDTLLNSDLHLASYALKRVSLSAVKKCVESKGDC
ncbi:speckle-type POZ protein B-like [Parasteatoda tepidariorum]|uniref:speckle-type POZ protein B-like n=1 Tax=Parasteatoda tepidariorum TaxID=114398 RepID=UPI00077FA538|nr:speckle-type POZ protein-like [Parasteatoda tepidariorum]